MAKKKKAAVANDARLLRVRTEIGVDQNLNIRIPSEWKDLVHKAWPGAEISTVVRDVVEEAALKIIKNAEVISTTDKKLRDGNIIFQFVSKVPVSQIARDNNVSRNSVYNILEEYGIRNKG
ncbi:MAG: hypothetical protein R3C28_30925 [Pirellulaceae bacterium]